MSEPFALSRDRLSVTNRGPEEDLDLAISPLYLSMSDVGSAYGAAGSLIVILAWIYYSALILFFGAELTQAWATQQGRSPRPERPSSEQVS